MPRPLAPREVARLPGVHRLACLLVLGAATVARADAPARPRCVTPTAPSAPTDPAPFTGARASAQASVFFVNYDGVTLTAGERDDAAANATSFAEFVGTYAPYGVGSKRAASLQAVRADWAAYAVTVVDARPAEGLYTMGVVTPTNPFGEGVLGAAASDCDDATASSVVLAFHGVDDDYSAVAQATTISHEIAHGYGLEHVDWPADVMNPAIAGDDPAFLDECLPLNGGGLPIRCAAQHRRDCGVDRQRSHQELLRLFGPSTPDLTPPVVVLTRPAPGEVVTAGAPVTVVAEATDDLGVAAAELFLDDASRGPPDWGSPYQWVDESFEAGRHCLRVDVRDHGSNPASSPEVCFKVVPDESSDDDSASSSSPDAADTDDTGCDCAAAPPAAPLAALLVVLLPRRRRRRPRPLYPQCALQDSRGGTRCVANDPYLESGEVEDAAMVPLPCGSPGSR